MSVSNPELLHAVVVYEPEDELPRREHEMSDFLMVAKLPENTFIQP